MNRTSMRWQGFRRRALTLSYDDGVVFDRRLIEIMNKNGLRGTFNINSGLFAKESGGRRLTKEEAQSLYSGSGMEVAAHGVRHLSLTDISDSCAINDIINDRLALEELFGTIVDGMAYANGLCDGHVAELMKMCGIKYARDVVKTEGFDIPDNFLLWRPTTHHANARLMELAREFIESDAKRPLLFYLWGHSYEFNDKDNWQIIEEFAEFMGGRDDIWYATNKEVYDYVCAFDSLRYSADGALVHNPSAIDVFIAYYDREYVIKAGETVRVIPKNYK